jgi:streptogramin lyase
MTRQAIVAIVVRALAVGCGDNDESDAGYARVHNCNAPGVACTWLGIPGQVGFNGDGHDRLHTLVYWTMDMLFAQDGTVWFIDWNNHLVRKVTDDKVVTVVGWTDPVFPGDGDPTDPTAEKSPQGAPGGDVQLNHPTDLYQTPDGTVLLMAWHNHKLREVDPVTGYVHTVCGASAGFAGDGGPATLARFKQPSRLTLDESFNVYLIDQQNERVRKIDAQTQMISTVVGNGIKAFAGDNGPATQASLSFAIGDNPEPAGGIVYRGGMLYIADTDNHRIRRVDLGTGIITTLAGTGQPGYLGDGMPATDAMLYHPRDLEIGPEGDLYVADTDNGVVRAIDLTSGTIRTVVGTGTLGLDADDGRTALATQLDRPFGIDFDPEGNLYVSDSLNSRIVRVAR